MPTKRRPGSRNPSQVQALSVREFFARFQTDEACLEHIMEVRYGLRHPCDKCFNLSTFHKLSGRPAYSCAHCGHHVYPCAHPGSVRIRPGVDLTAPALTDQIDAETGHEIRR
jgi:hypothetical protein